MIKLLSDYIFINYIGKEKKSQGDEDEKKTITRADSARTPEYSLPSRQRRNFLQNGERDKRGREEWSLATK